MTSSLFANSTPVGLLKGFSPVPHQLEVEVVVPHSERGLPGFGEFLLVEVNETTALVGRVSRYQAAGQLTSVQGDAYLADLAKNAESVPAPIMRQMLRYNLKIQLLGQLRLTATGFQFAVGERAFATLGSQVREPSDAALAFLCNVGLENDPTAAPLGHLVYGQRVLDKVPVNFSVARLKGKRSFVFARAGYGKSNLIKYLVSQLYSSPPDVGLLIFDPEGEYALPDAHRRPGLVNVPGLRNRISLYTNRRVPDEFCSVRRGSVGLDFRVFYPQDIVEAFVPAEKQDAVFANLLRSLDRPVWQQLVEAMAEGGYATDDKKIASLLSYRSRGKEEADVIIGAIKNNLWPPLRRLHDPESPIGKNIVEELRQARVVIVDLSLLGSSDGLAVSGMLLRRVFQQNVVHITERGGPSVRCLAVLEEAQTVLGDRRLDDSNIFVRWVKEGRKYGLGAILVTQQPGAIADQIISQGDNFFALHLLNDADLQTLQRHNAHYTDEILDYLRAEPIIGNCYFWSAPHQPFVLPVRVADFESVCQKPSAIAAASPPKKLPELVAQAVKEALTGNPRVWLYLVSSFNGKKEDGWLAFSADYLHSAVAQVTGADTDELTREIAVVLQRHKARSGFAVLEGITRRVWAIPQSHLKFKAGKKPRPTPVELADKL
jgi:DNA helicase HerA-like ATPase